MCALRYIATNAKTYNIDLNRLVLSGESAEALPSFPDNRNYLRRAPVWIVSARERRLPRAAAIINWYGITDVADVIDGPTQSQSRGAVDGESAQPRRDRSPSRVASHLDSEPGPSHRS